MYEQDVKESQGVLWKHRDLRSKKISVTNTPKDSSEVEDLKIIKLEIMLQNIKKKQKCTSRRWHVNKAFKMMFDIGFFTHVFDTWIRKEICLK